METYWVPVVNHLGHYGRWAFAEFCNVYEIEAKVASDFDLVIENTVVDQPAGPTP